MTSNERRTEECGNHSHYDGREIREDRETFTEYEEGVNQWKLLRKGRGKLAHEELRVTVK